VTAFSTTDTFGSLIEEVRMSLSGYGVDNDLVCSLSADIGAADLLIGVSDTSAVSRGIIEIDDEILYVKSNSSGTLTIEPFGRGFKGTTAAAHTTGAMVSINPTYPRSIVSREVNNTIRAVYPDLFAVKATNITTDGNNWQYVLPADLDRVLLVDAKWTVIDGWEPVREWDVTHSADTSDYATGKFLSLGAPWGAGVTIRVTYAAEPTLLSASTDVFSTVTGLPSSSRDGIVYGAAARLLPWLDTGRVPVETVMADLADANKPLGGAVSLAREMRQNYQLALRQEREQLLAKYPIKTRRTR
jgi:hypothetical protein